MNRTLYITMPVKDPAKSREFFGALGFTFNPQFEDGTGNGACLVINDNSFVMLAKEEVFIGLSNGERKPVDTSTSSEVYLTVSAESREAVDQMIEKAKSLGAGVPEEEEEQYDFMYMRHFSDLDGHIWNVSWMAPQA